uniref:HTH cro/C1-type domain-containing protein n=1 Tax=Thermosporothrix sp. COM3 TaxID=2490863 RepID=A0A455SJX3_9CHLR|nr:hypothetical protein KTC_20100 [Thermosporothrix sp. COM3]
MEKNALESIRYHQRAIKNGPDIAEREYTMKKALHPNQLKKLLTIAGLSQREAAQETNIPEGTFRHYVAGDQVIPRRDRVKIAQVIGCDIQALAPQYDVQDQLPSKLKGKTASFEADEYFAFGSVKTNIIILDGDGTDVYIPENIHTFYDPQPATFFDEVIQAKKQIQQEQEERKRSGKPYQWNGAKVLLSRIVISREPVHEQMTLSLWFKPRDHYIGLATRRCLEDPAFRQKYLPDDWSAPVTGLSCSMGIHLTVVSSDGYAILAQRGQHQSVHQNMFSCSISEGISPSFDRSTTGPAPDLYRCACRGLAEELGLLETDYSEIQMLSLSVDTQYALYGLHGLVKVNKRAEEIIRNWQTGVKDKQENKKLFVVPFTPSAISSFVVSHQPFSGGLISIYHSLVHEFGKAQVNAAISHVSQEEGC